MSTLKGDKKVSIERTISYPTFDRQRRCTIYNFTPSKEFLNCVAQSNTSHRWGIISAENTFLARERYFVVS